MDVQYYVEVIADRCLTLEERHSTLLLEPRTYRGTYGRIKQMASFHTFFLDSCADSLDFNGDKALTVSITFGTNADRKDFLYYLEQVLDENLD